MENQTSHPSSLSSNTDSPGNRPIKIMPLGDSITEGYFFPGGYRIDLQPAMESRGHTIEFVGSLSNGPDTLLSQHHEGHSGWRIEEISDRIVEWLQTFQPDIILLLIGTNNIGQWYQVETASYRLNQLVDRIFQTAPTVQLFLASIPPMSEPTLNQRVIQYNHKSEELVKEKQQEGQPIDFVDLYSTLSLADLPDGVHPNSEGFRKIARALEAGLSAYLS